MTCEYPTRKQQHGELQPCGKPAAQQATTGARLRYCVDCAKIVSRAIKLKPISQEAQGK